MNMQIAGVNFSLSYDQSVTFRNPPSNYQQFLTDTDRYFDSIAITLELDNFPDTGKMTRIFDSVQSWALFLEGDDYFLEYKPPAFREPFWVARLDNRFEKATVHFGGMLISENDGKLIALNPFLYPLDQLLLMHILAKKNGALIHSAGMGIQGRGFIFPGRSGAGKSTLSRLFLGRDTIDMLSDDRVVVRKVKGVFDVFGTPWAGDAGIAENKNFPLSGMFFIHHADENMIKEIKPGEALERLMPVTSIPWYDEKIMSGSLSFCEDLVSHVAAYDLYFRPDSEVVDFIEKFVSS